MQKVALSRLISRTSYRSLFGIVHQYSDIRVNKIKQFTLVRCLIFGDSTIAYHLFDNDWNEVTIWYYNGSLSIPLHDGSSLIYSSNSSELRTFKSDHDEFPAYAENAGVRRTFTVQNTTYKTRDYHPDIDFKCESKELNQHIIIASLLLDPPPEITNKRNPLRLFRPFINKDIKPRK